MIESDLETMKSGLALQNARVASNLSLRALADAQGLDSGRGFPELLRFLPQWYQPMISAMVEENMALLQRTEKLSAENFRFLTVSAQQMQTVMQSMVMDAAS